MKAALALLFVLVVTACSSPPPAAPSPAPPAQVAEPTSEAGLSSVTLTPEAEARLAIETVPIEVREVAAGRVTGGEVVAPPGRSASIAAPMAGTLLAPASGAVPVAGTRVSRGQVIFRLRPLPANVDLNVAQDRLELARKRLKRAEQLLDAGAASERAVEDARAELAAAESAAGALAPASDAGGGVVPLASPDDGVLAAVHALPGQTVAASTALFEVVPRDELWVRVPLYAGEVPAVDSARGAAVRPLGAPSGTAGWSARRVAGPPTADPRAATSDLYFALSNAGGALRPGERVEVELRLREVEAASVVPWSAVVYDVNGGAWVYEAAASHVFARRRVQVRRVEGDLAVLASGPAPGTRVVTRGVAELFGTELGNGK